MDKLAYSLPTAKVLGAELGWLPGFHEYVRSALGGGSCMPFFGAPGRFRYGVHLLIPSGSKVLVTYGVRDRKRQRYGVRVECNPARMTASDIALIHNFFRDAFGEAYPELLRACRIRRLDVAVDLVGARLDDLHVIYSHAQQLTVFGKRMSRTRGTIETLMFGSVSSSSAAAVYAKDVESLYRHVSKFSSSREQDDRLSDNRLQQLASRKSQPVVRVEVRLRKLDLLPSELCALENRLLRFAFLERSSMSSVPPLTARAFWSMCRDIGLKATMRSFDGHPFQDRLKESLSVRPSWWAPETAWEEALLSSVLRDLLTLSGVSGKALVDRRTRERQA
ncbi:hypothetical protein JJB11_21455 [Ramlibacter ginsenosidimutans]|uniref:Replication-associated protein G2P N-terminal domain-containing protein n=1 Tax=Ramlibacter ginsenosidimutans TaxID=502333 RepID=A0A934WPL7_9BURK|nr:phage/plasmid replication protein [Ramlibacter ginsenosidimutans]MBK6008676.1 hypothetical protein [Ramlibacter ginsenosidimutans]